MIFPKQTTIFPTTFDISLDKIPGKCYAIPTNGTGSKNAYRYPPVFHDSISLQPANFRPLKRSLRLYAPLTEPSGSKNFLCLSAPNLTKNFRQCPLSTIRRPYQEA